MASYIVFTKVKTTDQAELDIYSSLIGQTLAGRPVNILAAYGEQQVLEGPSAEGVVIAEFPTKADALAWYNSPEYQEVSMHRINGALYTAILVEGRPTT